MMDVYEFSERDDQTLSQKKSLKKKQVIPKVPLLKANVVAKKSQRKKKIANNKIELNPPIKLKLVRDQSDPQLFKSIQIINDASQASEFSFDINQQSLLHCKLTDSRQFAINDIVWAKISGYPFWPSKILSINLSTSNQKSDEEFIACVEWLAYDQISYVNCTNLSHFHLDFCNKYSGKIKNKKYFEAVNEAKILSDENAQQRLFDSVATNDHRPEDSVHSYEATEADTSSTLPPSHNFTSPESNLSVQSFRVNNGARSNPLSNQSDRSLHSNTDYPPSTSDLQNAHHNFTAIDSTNWELPDLGSNLDFESNNHIPEFSDYEDDCDNIDISKIEFLIDETHKVANL